MLTVSPGALFRGALAAALSALTLLSPPATAQPAPEPGKTETVLITVDQAKVIKLPEKAQTVIVGNPGIADVSVQKSGVMVVTGKSFGVTNLIALDARGGLLAESLVRVRAATDSILTVQRGLDRESYSCTPTCQPTAQIGDANSYFGDIGGQMTRRNALATGGESK
ncbi:pilus assembly protein [Bosea caraganae]|uniref:Pilus assembly protein n=1 Tax=Bosea caraganae TaxID=2763117 RepID=A0A370L9D0_9HYPH|nr:pilus assembly protein N-terminal domain-containing protein [Bosea caraganae]RDJ26877.1 pilus assembly protein [Bosea caraganae]RDJ30765.1 pilus assembly protein [Bosea caraganae]